MNLLGLLVVTMLPAAPAAPPVFQTEQFVYVSAVEGRDVRAALQSLRQRLKAVRLAPADVVSVTVYRTDREQGSSFEKEWRGLFKGDPPALTELLAQLTGDARVAVSAVAARRGVAKRSIAGRAVESGGTLFLPGLIARSAAATGSIEEQTVDVMRQQEEILHAAGWSFADLVVTRIYLSEPSDYSGLNDGYRKFVTAPPPARATVHVSPVVPGQRIQIQSIAVKGSGAGRPSGPGITSPIHSYSVKAGRRLYITGMTGRRSDGLFPKDLAGQAEVSLATIEEQLQRHGMGFADVVETLVWIRNPDDWASIDSLYQQRMGKRAPALTVVGIPPNSPEGLIEIMMLAEQ